LSALESDDPRHGTHVGYTHHHCRCDACREFRREYMREFRQRDKAIESYQMRSRAQSRALFRLKAAHEDEYQRYYGDELLTERRRAQ